MRDINRLMLLTCAWSLLVGPAAAQEVLSGKTLVEALRKGGYNIYFRHAATDWTQQDQVINAGDWDRLSTGIEP